MDSGAECPWPFFIVRPIFSLGSDGALIVHGVGTSSNTSRQPVPEVKHLLTPPMNQGPLLFCCRLRAASCSPAPSQRYLRQMPTVIIGDIGKDRSRTGVPHSTEAGLNGLGCGVERIRITPLG